MPETSPLVAAIQAKVAPVLTAAEEMDAARTFKQLTASKRAEAIAGDDEAAAAQAAKEAAFVAAQRDLTDFLTQLQHPIG